MNNKIIDLVSNLKLGSLLFSYAAADALCVEVGNYNCYPDARAACFAALGNAQVSEKPACVVIGFDEIPSVHTALTETAFQNQTVVVIALREKSQGPAFDSIKKTRSNICSTTLDGFLAVFREEMKKKGPSVIILDFSPTNKDEKNNRMYFDDMSSYDYVYTDRTNILANSITVGSELGYGVVSSYFGYLAGGKSGILIADYTNLLKDISIFINYKNLLIATPHIVICNCCNVEYLKWIEEQGFTVFFSSENHFSAEHSFIEYSLPSILFYKGELS